MNGFGAKAYSKVAVDTGASLAAADPHALVLMLFDGALEAARQGLGQMQAGRIVDKAAALSKATRIVDEGLKASLDQSAGGQLALRLRDLYEYMTMRLLQANLRNDAAALLEVIGLLDQLRGAWMQIRKAEAPAVSAQSTASQAATSSADSQMPAVSQASATAAAPSVTRLFGGAYPQPLRRLATA